LNLAIYFFKTGSTSVLILILILVGCNDLNYDNTTPISQIDGCQNALEFLSEKNVQKESEIMDYAFTGPLISNDFIHPAIVSLNDILQVNISMFMKASTFFAAYDNLIVDSAESLSFDRDMTKVLRLNYQLGCKPYSAFAYGDISEKKEKAILIIPGSGMNQSYGIYVNDPNNYHYGIIDAVVDDYNTFVFIKPNEDILSFHNGNKKLSYDFITNWQLNRGSSYSATYIVHSLAIMKYLQSQYPTVAVAGLSQGGAAALLNALQSKPNAAIISSGYSIILQTIAEWSGFNQIILPGVSDIFRPDQLIIAIDEMETEFLFTYGSQEADVYGIEAEEQLTCSYFEHLSNVQCRIHSGGHSFPNALISSFLSDIKKSR
jgi:hypothetical protein